jgi:hypothetical protein
MDLIGSYCAQGYTVEAYFPEQDDPEAWKIWVIRDGNAVGEFTTRIAVDSVYGVNDLTMKRLKKAANAAVHEVVRREALDHCGEIRGSTAGGRLGGKDA